MILKYLHEVPLLFDLSLDESLRIYTHKIRPVSLHMPWAYILVSTLYWIFQTSVDLLFLLHSSLQVLCHSSHETSVCFVVYLIWIYLPFAKQNYWLHTLRGFPLRRNRRIRHCILSVHLILYTLFSLICTFCLGLFDWK